MGAYEGGADEDNDPNDETQAFGYNPGTDPGEYAAVFVEVIRDAVEDDTTIDPSDGKRWYAGWDKVTKERRTVVHEIGHQFELQHVHKSVMATRDKLSGVKSETAYDRFHEMDLALIRAVKVP